ncbi:MFS transporter [uncultured Sneathiella sp.]|uniref:MFS transporter n=1 Tax=uncultured Sneathiella sp. TaxID=879315 RepID=UPI0030EF9BB0|tara:strand:- start:13854 stop:15227 length:1374 start_codon:yes stop_codon:yes gene_type:complete
MRGIDDKNRRWWVLAAMGGVLALIVLDETILGVALPTLREELGMSEIASHWVVNSYLLVFAGLVAAGGRLGDILGLRNLFLIGISIFGVASLLCGFMNDGTMLIVMRGIQGIGAAIILPASMAMLTIVFPENERGMALGAYGAIGTIGLISGPLAGGALVETLSWRWIFWINPAIVIAVALVVMKAWINPPRMAEAARFDFGGLISLIAGLGLIVFALMQGPDWGWQNPTVWIPLVMGIVASILFVLIELRTKQPLIEVDLFTNASFAICNFVVFAAQFSKISIFIFGALYLQHQLNFTAIEAGIALLPAVMPAPLSAPMAGHFADRLGARKPIFFGIALSIISFFWIAVVAEMGSYLYFFPALIVWGIGLGFLFVPPMRAVMNEVPLEKQGLAGGIVLSAQMLGGTVGMAISSVLFSTFRDYQVVFLAAATLFLILLPLAIKTIRSDEELVIAEKG